MPAPVLSARLRNGLEVRLKEVHTAPVISSWLWYRVGSRNERTGRTGVSHWVEHMLFKGTPSFPARELDRAISRDGGYWNAFTWLDWTTFFTMPANKADPALRLEADRMVHRLLTRMIESSARWSSPSVRATRTSRSSAKEEPRRLPSGTSTTDHRRHGRPAQGPGRRSTMPHPYTPENP
jgi:zinc protease